MSAIGVSAPPTRLRPPVRRRPGLSRWWPLALVAVLILVPGAWVALRPGPSPITEVDRYPGIAPGEWGPGATWASPRLSTGTHPIAAGDDIALVTAERHLLLVGADGAVRWDAPIPDGDIRSAPAPTRIGGREVLAAHVGDRLRWWELGDGSGHDLDLPSGARVSLLGEVPLVAVGGAEVMAITGDDPTPLRIPEGTTALAAHEDGTITAAGPSGWWHLAADGSVGSSGPWENPSAVSPTVVGYTGGFVLLVRPGDPAVLELHADRTSDVRYVVGGPVVLPAGPGGPLTWHASPAGAWGILGRTLVDLRAGTITDLGAWSTRIVTADRAYGHIDGRTVVVGPGIPRGVLAPGEAVPDVVTAAGAVVRGPATPADGRSGQGVDPRSDADDIAYFLPPRRTAS